MKGYDYVSLFFSASGFFNKSENAQKKIIDKRLKNIVKYAKENSPYLANLYKNLKEDFRLEDIPPVNKRMMMDNYDDYVTDRDIRIEDINKFTSDLNNLSNKYLNKYLVATTSGSTGVPCVVLHDRNSLNAAAILSCLRFMKLKMPLAAFCVDDVFLIENGNVRHNIKKMPMLKNKLKVINAKNTHDKIAKEINELQPKTVIGYSGTVELLADMVNEGKISISPKQVLCSGEFLTPETRKKMEKAFGCKPHAIYGCTEGNVMAYECEHNHLHLSSDQYILEPVDNDNNPVPEGQLSDKVLLTYFGNFVQPIIRFEMTDRIKMHTEPCSCGRKGPWFEIEGRSNDVLTMTGTNGKVKIAPLPFIFVVEPLAGINNFQLVLHPENTIELRIDFIKGADKEAVFQKAKEEIEKHLLKFNVTDVKVYLSGLMPQRCPRTGKFRQMYQTDEPYTD